MESIEDFFGCLVFNDDEMRERLPKDVYKALRQTVDQGKDLDLAIANPVANAMKNWALEKGCTHYTHWFQPMTGITAEKHDAFIASAPGGRAIFEFSGKELIKGEPDASSFPSGGLRATFEARGYTAWDPTSYAFIKDGTLCIPTAFCSYSGEVLDKKTPLLRSMEAVAEETKKILSLFGKNPERVITTVGPEQEYFLIDKKDYERRKDLIYTGRTLIGARAPKGQELEDHYFGALRTRVSEYMQDLDMELWKLGVYANQLTMEIMKKTAERHGFACLLHEKPFAGMNGSGKHNNWSLSTEDANLLEPGDNPKDNAQFLLFLAAVIKGVDEYQDLLRVSVASAGNDHRLGGYEAPPAIVSIFLGDELTGILEALAVGHSAPGRTKEKMQLGVHVLPAIPKDTTDRNRTSPFAFTGNKFEFRMLGSSFSVAEPNTVLNTVVAKELKEFYEKLKDAEDFNKAVSDLVRDTYIAHRRIVFNGNNYSSEWVEEARRRGLLNLATSPDAFDTLCSPKNIALFSEFGIYSSVELHSRYEILNDEYSKTVHIEALTLIDMINREILPAVMDYSSEIATGICRKKGALPEMKIDAEEARLAEIEVLISSLYNSVNELERIVSLSSSEHGSALAHYSSDKILPQMLEVRKYSDSLELICSKKHWPIPTYGEMLFYV